MTGSPRRRLPPETWEILAAALILAWRFGHYPAATWWRDWVTVVCVFWILTALAGRTRAWPPLMGAFMAFLFALYALLQAPHGLAALGMLR